MDQKDGPMPLGSGRPERYDFEDNLAASPANYTLLKSFDASHIFNKNPHKFDKLVAQEDGYSKDDLGISSQLSPDRPAGGPKIRRGRSASLTTLDSRSPLLFQPQATVIISKPEQPSVQDEQRLANYRASNMHRRCSLDRIADYYTYRSSDAVSIDATTTEVGFAGSGSPPKSMATAVTSFTSTKPKAEVIKPENRENRLTDIMMKAGFKEPAKQGTTKSPRAEASAQNSDRAGGTPKAPEKNPTFQLENKPSDSDINVASDNKQKTSNVYPQPRRLFGIGPMYRPLPETVVEGVATQDGSLTSRIKKEGIDAGKDKTVKKAPTKAEMNSWSSFSM